MMQYNWLPDSVRALSGCWAACCHLHFGGYGTQCAAIAEGLIIEDPGTHPDSSLCTVIEIGAVGSDGSLTTIALSVRYYFSPIALQPEVPSLVRSGDRIRSPPMTPRHVKAGEDAMTHIHRRVSIRPKKGPLAGYPRPLSNYTAVAGW
jgi:hypothetical protein